MSFKEKKAPEISRNSPPGPPAPRPFGVSVNLRQFKKNSKKTFLHPSQKRKSSFLSYFWSSRPFPLPPLRKRSRHKKPLKIRAGPLKLCHLVTYKRSVIYIVPRTLSSLCIKFWELSPFLSGHSGPPNLLSFPLDKLFFSCNSTPEGLL